MPERIPEAWGIPSIGLGRDTAASGDSTEGPYTNSNNVFEIIDNVSWLRGNHSFKVGGSIRFDQFNQVGNQFPRGGFQFNGNATSPTGVHTGHRNRVCRLPAWLSAPRPNCRPALAQYKLPREEPVVLLHRHVEHAR